MNAPRVKSVKPLTERRLLVTFVNGMQKVYDCQGIMHLDRFQSLKNETFFNTVTVDPGGYGVSWNDETDLSEYELWSNGIEVDAVSEKMRGFLKGIDTTVERDPDHKHGVATT